MSDSRHLSHARKSTFRAWASLGLYVAAGTVLNFEGEALAYYAAGLAVIGMWAAGGEALITALSTLRHVGEGWKGKAAPRQPVDERPR
jgi:hypothetical protein